MATTWLENISTPLLPNASESMITDDWDMVHTIIPPYIFTLCVLGLLLNSFVLVVFLLHKDRLTVAEIYLSNLALADFILLCGLPFWAMSIQNNYNWSYGEFLCKMVNSSIIINFYTSIYTLVMISVDRYLAIVKTMRARWLRRRRYAKAISLNLWMFGLVLSTPVMVYRKVLVFEEYESTACALDYNHSSSGKLSHQILLNVAGFALPVLVIVFCSGSIIKQLAQRRERVAFHDIKDSKAILLMYAVTLLFLICWGPFQIFTFLDTLCDFHVLDENLWFHTLDIGGQVSVYLAFLNSTLNPLLYVISGQYFRRKVSAIYRRTRQTRRGSDMTTFQRSFVSTYINRPEQIKPVVIL
ncbi:B1 bradykinin receptor [Cheilinus undulatus]|uniref:B1 bradykinin receptor n=1 Tax=Cheilinus undulatus TaxID=241271 RepID=UPI001BD2E446|nr:B1 bradykinin receptor [Cheilinus undulatus]